MGANVLKYQDSHDQRYTKSCKCLQGTIKSCSPAYTIKALQFTSVTLVYLTFQVSNEIIKRCSTKISLEDIFEGRIKTSMQGLQESIECCESWKHTYSKVTGVHIHIGSKSEHNRARCICRMFVERKHKRLKLIDHTSYM